jgi:GGDEF domain-containing protein
MLSVNRLTFLFRCESILKKWPARAIKAFCCALILVAGAIDYATSTEFIALNLYLLPIVIAAWFLEQRAAFNVAAFSAVIYIAADILSRTKIPHPLTYLWNVGSMVGFFFMIYSLTQHLRQFIHLRNSLARIDHLTEIANDVAFREALQTEIRRKERLGRHGTTSVACVVEHMTDNRRPLSSGEFNHVMKQMAQTIRMNLRMGEMVARLDGGRFAFLMPEASPKICRTVIEKVYYALHGAALTNEWPLSIRVCGLTYNELPEHADDILET